VGTARTNLQGSSSALIDATLLRRAAKGVGKKMTAALESLKVGWGGGSGKASPCSNDAASPKGAL